MRINLATPFAEKDQVKTLGARWDASKKVWYIKDVEDMEPFRRWIPKTTPSPAGIVTVQGGLDEAVHSGVADCGCDVLPWDDCIHTVTTP